jgi:hypothetical protein
MAIFQSLWLGTLGEIERLSIRSFLYHGHEFHLYAYENVGEVPKGTVLKDARDILPLRLYPDKAIFADLWRYYMLYSIGNWWTDLDIICYGDMKAYENDDFVAGKESFPVSSTCNALIKSTAGAKYMKWMIDEAEKRFEVLGPRSKIGPMLLTECIKNFKLQPKPLSEFYDFYVQDWIIPWSSPPTSHCVHLWSQAWRDMRLNINASYHYDSNIERIRRKYKETEC